MLLLNVVAKADVVAKAVVVANVAVIFLAKLRPRLFLSDYI